MTDLISRLAVLDALENIDCSDGVGLSTLKVDAQRLTQNIATANHFNTINCRANDAYVSISLEDQVKEILNRLTNPKLMRIKCHQCGASIDQRPDNHIVKCPYCRTTYFIGTRMVHDEP